MCLLVLFAALIATGWLASSCLQHCLIKPPCLERALVSCTRRFPRPFHPILSLHHSSHPSHPSHSLLLTPRFLFRVAHYDASVGREAG